MKNPTGFGGKAGFLDRFSWCCQVQVPENWRGQSLPCVSMQADGLHESKASCQELEPSDAEL